MGRKAMVLLANISDIPEPEPGCFVICADSGYSAALEGGLEVDVLIGDMDSIREEDLSTARDRGVDIRSHPSDKDMADGELAVRCAVEMGADDILIVGGRTGRFDHVMSSLLIPFQMDDRIEFRILLDGDRFLPLREGRTVESDERFGSISIIPLSEGCRVQTRGLKWKLKGELLTLGSTRGIHNEVASVPWSISCSDGQALVHLSCLD